MYFYASLSSYNYCPLLRWVNMQEQWVNITGIYSIGSATSLPQTLLGIKKINKIPERFQKIRL